MQSEARITFGELFSGTFDLCQRNPKAVAAFVAATTLVELIFGLGGMAAESFWPGILIGFFAGYFLIEHVLEREGLRTGQSRGGGLGPYLGVSILAGLGMLFGLLIFILPGLVLMSRWMIAAPLAVTGDQSTTGAMRVSWDATRNSQWSLVGFWAVYFLVAIVIGGAVGGAAVVSSASGVTQQVMAVGGTVAAQGLAAFGTLVMVTAMVKLTGPDNSLGEVFA